MSIGTVPFANYVFCMCYLGFRPSEALDLRVEDYNRKIKLVVMCFVIQKETILTCVVSVRTTLLRINENERSERLLTLHCCRHTFANLYARRRQNKLALIGHTAKRC